MSKQALTVSAVILLVFFFGTVTIAAKAPPKVGEQMPPITLKTPDTKAQKAYLGVGNSPSFSLSDIKGRIIIIEIFSMYCPHCQRHAPEINKFYNAIESDPKLRGKIKLIGIGVGNSPFEVNYFKKRYSVPFPLIPDEDFRIHKIVGEVRTPYFIGVKLSKNGDQKVFYSKLGGFDNYKEFLDTIIRLSGLKSQGTGK